MVNIHRALYYHTVVVEATGSWECDKGLCGMQHGGKDRTTVYDGRGEGYKAGAWHTLFVHDPLLGLLLDYYCTTIKDRYKTIVYEERSHVCSSTFVLL